MRRPHGALLVVGLAAGVSPAANPGPAPALPVEAVVDRLGAAAFAAREAAAKELLRRGPGVLAALDRAAVGHPDPEARVRAAALADRLRRVADGDRLLATRRVKLDYADVPLGTAVADLRSRTDVLVALDEKGVTDPGRRVTVSTPELPAWEAVEAFCRAAGLHEVHRADLGPAQPDAAPAVQFRRQPVWQSRHLGTPGPQVPAYQVPVLLADGPAATLPGDRGTAVRVLALPAGFPSNRVVRGAGRVVLNLDVTPLAGVRWDDVLAVRVFRAEDETGRPVTTSYQADPPAAGASDEMVFLGGMGGQIMWDGYGQPTGVDGRPNPRVVPVALRTDDRSVRALRAFEGVVVGEVTVPDQELAALDDLPRAVGATATGPSDSRFTLQDYKTAPDGRVTVKVRVEGTDPWLFQRTGRKPGLLVGAVMVWDGPAQPNAARLRFFDAAGKPLPPPPPRSAGSMGNDGFRQWLEYELDFPKRDGFGLPARLAVTGNKPAVVEVPFKLKDVPLP